MGDIADDLVEGFSCQQCGQTIDGDSPGFPRVCTDCGGDAEVDDSWMENENEDNEEDSDDPWTDVDDEWDDVEDEWDDK